MTSLPIVLPTLWQTARRNSHPAFISHYAMVVSLAEVICRLQIIIWEAMTLNPGDNHLQIAIINI
jgi:hypothetical protein